MANPFALAVRQMDGGPYRVRAGYEGAAYNRLTADFAAQITSINRDIEAAGRTLRARARTLVQNNGYAAGFVQEAVNNVIGPDGIQLRAQIRKATGKRALAKPTNEELERGWKAWGVPEYASADGRLGWVDIEAMLMRCLVIDGEFFLRHIRGADTPFGYAVELLDPDLIDDTFSRPPAPGVNEIRMGIELGAFGRPVAYHVWNRHPSDAGKRTRMRIDASEIEHKFIPQRPGQIRGVSWFAPVLVQFKMLAGYEEAELVAARTAASKMGFFVAGEDAIVDENEPATLPTDAAPGTFDKLPKGYTFEGFDPQHPTAAFKEFSGAILRGIGRGLGASYLTMTGDVSAANYSSMRAGLLPERDHWRGVQKWLARHCHRRVYGAWLEMALLGSALRVDSRLASSYQDVQWMPRGWKWVDPMKDAMAAKELLGLGLESRTRLAAEQGDDFEEIIDELAAEQDYADTEGIDISGTLGTPAAMPADPTDPASDPAAPAAPNAPAARASRLRRVS